MSFHFKIKKNFLIKEEIKIHNKIILTTKEKISIIKEINIKFLTIEEEMMTKESNTINYEEMIINKKENS